MTRKILIFMTAICVCMMMGCNSAATVEEKPAEQEAQQEADKPDTAQEDKNTEEPDATDVKEAEEEPEKTPDPSFAVGSWYTEDYDEYENWSGSYEIALTPEGTASCTGWRNKDNGYYEVTGDDKVLITFDHCETDVVGEGWQPVEDFVYTIEMTINGDEAQIKIDAPDVITNLMDGPVYRGTGDAKSEKSDDEKGDIADIADGSYLTDMEYSGDITSDGATVTIKTGLNHYDDDWNEVVDYEKKTYVFPTSKDCKFVVFEEDAEEFPISEKIDFINEVLEGKSGLPLTLVIMNHELVEIELSS